MFFEVFWRFRFLSTRRESSCRITGLSVQRIGIGLLRVLNSLVLGARSSQAFPLGFDSRLPSLNLGKFLLCSTKALLSLGRHCHCILAKLPQPLVAESDEHGANDRLSKASKIGDGMFSSEDSEALDWKSASRLLQQS